MRRTSEVVAATVTGGMGVAMDNLVSPIWPI
jgi:hypothetical protein